MGFTDGRLSSETCTWLKLLILVVSFQDSDFLWLKIKVEKIAINIETSLFHLITIFNNKDIW